MVLSRKSGEKIKLSNGVIISVETMTGSRVTLGIEAPLDIGITRSTPCIVCLRPTFEYYLGYRDLPVCGREECEEELQSTQTDKSLFQ